VPIVAGTERPWGVGFLTWGIDRDVVELALSYGPRAVMLAAGGSADGRGVAAALVLSAAGALIGARFQATTEALVDPSITKAILEGRGQDTERSTVLDIAR
jgi:NAD(P)H-dependent flavin oxidoreductase YrpB (nitropropane dioxygenase family)